MKKLLFVAFVGALSASASLSAAVTIAANGVKNSASYANPAFPNGSIAQGSLFVVFGSGMGPAQIQYASSFPLPVNLLGTSVSVTVNGTTVQCPMIYTLDGQIAAILPSNTPVGSGTMVVSYNGTNSSTAPIKVGANSPGLFAVNQQGSGSLVVQDASGKPNSLTFAFAPGQTVVLWGTGLGPISGSDASQPAQTNLPGGIKVAVNIGGQNAQVVYAGRSQDAGVDQINVVIPSGVTGCYVPVYLTVTGANGVSTTSNFGTMSIAAGGTACVDPGFPQSTTGGNYKIGSVGLSRSSIQLPILGQTYTSLTDGGSGVFLAFDPTYLAYAAGNYYDYVNGSCFVFMYNSVGSVPNTPQPRYLNAGSILNVTGPNGTKQLTMQPSLPGIYSATLGLMSTLPGSKNSPLYLDPGSYTVDNGTGGADVGPFKLSINVPPAFIWTNQSSITSIDRTQPLRITWSGGDPNAQVLVTGGSYAVASAYVSFICSAKDSDGGLTVPPAILSLLPPSATLAAGAIGGSLVISTSTSVTGSAPGLDLLGLSDSFSIVASGIPYK